jgi:hypothetical protein
MLCSKTTLLQQFLRQILYLPIGPLFLQLLVQHLLTKILILLNSFVHLCFKILLCYTLLLLQIIASILHLLLRGSHYIFITFLEGVRYFFSDFYSPLLRLESNLTHHYETRFHKKYLAQTYFIDDSDETPFDDNLYSAFVQDSYPIHSGTELSFLEHFSCAAQSNPDVLHFVRSWSLPL